MTAPADRRPPSLDTGQQFDISDDRSTGSADLGPLIEAVVDLAWRPTSNTSHRAAYTARMESHEALTRALRAASPTPDDNDPLGYLMRATKRAAAATYSNRCGAPYRERKEAIYQLRGALIVWLNTEWGDA